MFRRKFIRLGAGLLMILALTLPVANPALAAVTSATPAFGPDEGGNTVTVNGSGFSGVTGVSFCQPAPITCSAAGIVSSSATAIVVTAPVTPSAFGAADILVTATAGGGTCTGCYRYDAITLTGTSSGTSAGPGATLTLLGLGFNPGATTQV